MPARVKCPGCNEEGIPVKGERGQLNCRECDLVLVQPAPEPESDTPTLGQVATCYCGRKIRFTGEHWTHKLKPGDSEYRHPARPVETEPDHR